MRVTYSIFVIALLLGISMVACEQEATDSEAGMNKVTTEANYVALEQASKTRVYFGHQSVGDNILQGIKLFDPSGAVRIVDISDKWPADPTESGAFWHSKIGTNGEPISKLQEFRSVLHQGVGGAVDIAFMKFCYLDFDGTTDVEAVFSEYKRTMTELRNDFEQLTIVHATVPLRVNPEGWKTKIKKLFGKKDLWEYQDNIARVTFNRMLLAEFEGVEPVFDIAKVESTKINGSREAFTLDGKEYYALAPEYTADGGHLNSLGQRKAAERLIDVIAEISD